MRRSGLPLLTKLDLVDECDATAVEMHCSETPFSAYLLLLCEWLSSGMNCHGAQLIEDAGSDQTCGRISSAHQFYQDSRLLTYRRSHGSHLAQEIPGLAAPHSSRVQLL